MAKNFTPQQATFGRAFNRLHASPSRRAAKRVVNTLCKAVKAGAYLGGGRDGGPLTASFRNRVMRVMLKTGARVLAEKGAHHGE